MVQLSAGCRMQPDRQMSGGLSGGGSAARRPTNVKPEYYELTPAGRGELQRWVDDPLPAVRVRDTFFSKLLVAWKTRLADPLVLIDRQRRAYLRQLRELGGLADATTSLIGRLAVEAATLHVQADLKLLEFCEQAVDAGEAGAGG